MTKKPRARSAETKEARRASILKAARKIVDKSGFSALTVDAVVKSCGMAKGTFYIYFKTREDVLLAILQEDFTIWFGGFEAYLAMVSQPFGPHFVDIWITSVKAQPRLLNGMSYLHLMLEPNASDDFAYAWKAFLLQHLKGMHYKIIERFQPHISLETLADFFVILVGLSTGLWMQSSSSAPIERAFKKHPELQILKAKFEFHFKLAAAALLESPQFASLRQLTHRDDKA